MLKILIVRGIHVTNQDKGSFVKSILCCYVPKGAFMFILLLFNFAKFNSIQS